MWFLQRILILQHWHIGLKLRPGFRMREGGRQAGRQARKMRRKGRREEGREGGRKGGREGGRKGGRERFYFSALLDSFSIKDEALPFS